MSPPDRPVTDAEVDAARRVVPTAFEQLLDMAGGDRRQANAWLDEQLARWAWEARQDEAETRLRRLFCGDFPPPERPR